MKMAKILFASIALMLATSLYAGDWYLGVGSGLAFDIEQCSSSQELVREDRDYGYESRGRKDRGRLVLVESTSCADDDELLHSLYAGKRDVIALGKNFHIGGELGYSHVGPADLVQASAMFNIRPTQNILISPEVGLAYIDLGIEEDEVGVVGLWSTYDFNTGPVLSFARVGWRRYFDIADEDIDTIQVGFGVRTP